MGLIRIKVPLLYLVLVAGSFLVLGLFLSKPAAPVAALPSAPVQRMEELRVKSGRLVQPLLLADLSTDEPSLDPLRTQIETYLRQKEQAGEINAASVYFRDFNSARNFTINPSEQYSPASIMKIPVLITYLKESESNPGVLRKKVFFKKHFSAIPEQTQTAKPMDENRSYTVDDLLQRMIVDSDNDATALLNNNINLDGFRALFHVMGFREPDFRNWNYYLTVAECSRFMRILFYSTYLHEENSETAMQLLTQTNFRQGLMADIDPGTIVAHKFGERNINEEQQLHETGIFYLGDSPYLLTVMTKGRDRTQLPAILAEVSRMTWSYLKSSGV